MPKIKILYLLTKADIGGAQKYVKDLAENLDKGKFEIRTLTGGKYGAEFLSNAFRPYLFFLNDWLAVIELFFIFRKEKPHIIHLNSSKAGVLGSFAAWLYKKTSNLEPRTSNVKVVFTAHGWVFNPDNDLSWPLRRFYIFLHKIAARFQDKIINVSEYDRKLALKHKIAPPEKLITIYNGIDYKNLKFLDKAAARKTLSKLTSNFELRTSNLNNIWVGSIGRLVKEKNYETFIEAASLVKDKSVKFFIIGSGPEYSKLKAKSSKLKANVTIVENLAPAAPYLRAFDMFVLSSIKEGMPYTMLEAMAAELPIVTTRVGGMTEIIEGKGLVILPKEPSELARAIEHLLNNSPETQKFAKQAKQALNNDLGIEKMISKTTALYHFCHCEEQRDEAILQ